jgi:menaquinol-cytochrome c reductase iron-sulfur subunit
MQRRSLLIIASRMLSAGVAALVAVPGVQHVWNTLRPSDSTSNARRRLVRWKDLRPGEPAKFPIIGERRDAWHVQPSEVIGRVWLVRRSEEVEPGVDAVVAFTSLCPHMGCQVQRAPRASGFVCPCHRATFGLEGEPLQQGGEKNHAPRGLDQLPCEVVRDESGEWWVEVRYERFEPGLTQKVVKA